MPPSPPAELARLQRGFLARVTNRAPCSREALAALAAIDDQVQLDIYRRMYALRMAREVAREFPATRALLGAAVFGRVAKAFVAAHPSHSFTLEGYADAFPEFLAHASGRRASEIAALERAIWKRSAVRVRVAVNEAGLLRALLKGVDLERAVAIATRAGLAPEAIRRAFEHWVAAGLLELRYRSDPASIQVARCASFAQRPEDERRPAGASARA